VGLSDSGSHLSALAWELALDSSGYFWEVKPYLVKLGHLEVADYDCITYTFSVLVQSPLSYNLWEGSGLKGKSLRHWAPMEDSSCLHLNSHHHA
jgi:hypothetical protein